MRCPQLVNKSNWFEYTAELNGDETFFVNQNGTQLIVARTDKDQGWEGYLMFPCCREYGMCVNYLLN